MTEINKFYAEDNADYGGAYTLRLYADALKCKIHEEHYHNKNEYQEEEDREYATFSSAWADYSKKALDCPYRSKWWDARGEYQKAYKAYKAAVAPECMDDLADMTVEEIVPQETEEQPQLALEVEKANSLHPDIVRILEGLRSSAEDSIRDLTGQISVLEDEISALKAQKADKKKLIDEIGALLYPASPSASLFGLAQPRDGVTADELASSLGVPRRKIYKAIEKGELIPLPRCKGGKILFDRTQQGAAATLFQTQAI